MAYSMLRNCFGCLTKMNNSIDQVTSDAAAAAQLGSYKDALPTHFTFKIQSFSLLATSSLENFESNDFEAGGYKWRLVFYPKGKNTTTINTSTTTSSSSSLSGHHHVSMDLKIVDTNSLPSGWELDVSFRFFLLDQVRDKYMIIADMGERTKRFDKMNTMWGCLLPLTILNNSNNGFVVDDTFVFGVDVFPCKNTGCGGCLTMVKSPLCVKYSWKIENFSKIKEGSVCSDVFNAEGYKWNIRIYPKGDSRTNNENLSMFLCLNGSVIELAGEQVYAKFKLRVRDQLHNLHRELQQVGLTKIFTSSHKAWGFVRFMRLNELNDKSKGYLVNDTCIVEAEVTVLGTLKKLSSDESCSKVVKAEVISVLDALKKLSSDERCSKVVRETFGRSVQLWRFLEASLSSFFYIFVCFGLLFFLVFSCFLVKLVSQYLL